MSSQVVDPVIFRCRMADHQRWMDAPLILGIGLAPLPEARDLGRLAVLGVQTGEGLPFPPVLR